MYVYTSMRVSQYINAKSHGCLQKAELVANAAAKAEPVVAKKEVPNVATVVPVKSIMHFMWQCVI